ncbi:unnamed protein product [Meganyctiphanes norvegica]|uniref:Aminopeptidase n=1 Tax=Meganyctiphanes norvegica TaxID=48144 RepID=A0AAV2PUU6_MEGNR
MGTSRLILLLLLLFGFSITTSADALEQDNDINVRLPTALTPNHYKLKLQPFINGNFSVLGYVELEFEVREPTDSIMLHMLDTDIVNKTVKVFQKNNQRSQQILSQTYDGFRQFFIVKLKHRMVVGKMYIISMDFNTTLNKRRKGFYRSSYINENGVKRWVASTQFQSTDARRSFPCMDEPGLKATFDIYIARQKNMTALSNMPLAVSKPIDDSEWVWDHFEKSVPMSTYLVSYAVFDYKPITIPTADGRTKVKVWTRDAVGNKAIYGGELSYKCLKFFQSFFDVKYPLPKLDIIAPPEMSPNAMENWGLVTVRESGLLIDEASSANHYQWVSYLMAHELAHQWFGNAVTLKWWTDLWLNEGFATYMADYSLSKVSPELGTMEHFVVNRAQASMALDALSSSHPISVVVNNPVEINEIFDSISYNKGGSIIRMMKHFLTQETFREGLKNYFTEHMFKSAEQDDLWRHLDTAARKLTPHRLPDGHTVKEIMDTWTLQMGFPVLNVKRSYLPSHLYANISQQLFSFNKNSTRTSMKLWWIPITEIHKGQTFQYEPKLTWLGKQQGKMDNTPQDDRWLIINVLQTGYYRVNYDERNWELICLQLHENHKAIDVTNRAQIIDDALNLARADLLPYGSALKVTSYLKFEHHYVPWKAAVNGFTYVMDMLMHTPHYGPLKEYLLSVVQPVYEHLGLEDRSDDSLHTKELRGMIFKLACSLDHKGCVSAAKEMYAQWIADPEGYKVPSNLGQSVFCTVMGLSDRNGWEKAWQQYIITTDATQRKAMRHGFGCIKETWILQRYLSMAFDQKSGVKQQDASLIFGAVARSSVGEMVAWNYLRNNWDHIVE